MKTTAASMCCSRRRSWSHRCHLAVLVVLAASSSFPCGSSRQLRQMLGTNAAAWSSHISVKSSQLLIPVLPGSASAQQGPCPESAENLIKLPFTVKFKRSSSTKVPASAAVSFQAEVTGQQGSREQVVLQPCRVELDKQLVVPADGQQQQQQQIQLQQLHREPAAATAPQQQQQVQLQQPSFLQDSQQLLQDSSDVSYVAYFRHLPRSMCGKTPKAIITTTLGWEGQPPQTVSSTVDLLVYGCAFFIGDAWAEEPPIPEGMPQPQMKAAFAGSKRIDTPTYS